MRGVLLACLLYFLLTATAISFDKRQVGGWEVGGHYTQGVMYGINNGCYLLTIGGDRAGLMLNPVSGSDLPQIEVKTRSFFDSENIALYKIVDDFGGCVDLVWPKTIKAKTMLSKDNYGRRVKVSSVANGKITSIDAEISTIGANYICFSSESLSSKSSIAGSTVRLDGEVIGIAIGWGRCEAGGLGFVAKRIDKIEKELNAASLAPQQSEYSNRQPFRNGLYTGPMSQGLPHGSKGVFVFNIGEKKVFSHTGDEWKLSGSFNKGNLDGRMLFQGPIAEDGGSQECTLDYAGGSMERGHCNVYFDSYLSPLGIDPRILRNVVWGIHTLKEAAELNMVECDDPPACTKFSGGKMGMKGRYTGGVKQGEHSFFEPSSRILNNQLTEEYLVPNGTGLLLDEGMATSCWVGCGHVKAKGPNKYEGQWVDGSLTGTGSITMNHGAKLTGEFKLNYLMKGHAENATANMVGMAYNMQSDVYTGPILNGFEHGPDGMKTNEHSHSRITGEFREGSPWNATGAWTRDGVRYRCEWVKGNCKR